MRLPLPLRPVAFWFHLATGLVAGAIVFAMALTGVLLTFERQLVERADLSVSRVVPPAGAAPLSVEEQVRRTLAVHPEVVPTSLSVAADPRTATALALGREGVLFIDPYTGAPVGFGAKRLRAFFRASTEVHRFLALGSERRELGRALTGAANLAFLALVLSGLYLWVPRVLDRRRLRAVAWFRGGLSGKARDFNWHHAIGLWTAPALLVITVSGVVMSYDWANGLLFRWAGGEPPRETPRPAGARERTGSGDRPEAFDPSSLAGIDPLLRTARSQVAGWRTIAVRLPKPDDETITFSIARSHRGRPDLRATLELDRKSGALVAWRPFAEESAGRRARSWLRFLHTGEAGGPLGQLAAGIASAGSLVMVWTGFALAWRRLVVPRMSRFRSRNAVRTQEGERP